MARGMMFSGSLVAALLAAGLIVGGCEKKETPTPSKPEGTTEAKPAAAKSEYANFKCPIMGGKIVPADVTKDLSRDWKGLKVAFCCPSCPGPWDKLTDAQRAAKLKPVLNPGVKLPEVEAATKPAAETTAKPAETKPAETKPAK